MEDPAARVVKHSLRGAAIQLGGGATGEVFALIAPTAAAAVALLDVGFLRRVVAFVEHDLELLHYNVMIVRSIAQLKHPAGPGRSPSESVRAAAAVSGYVLRVRGRRDGVESASLLAAAAAGAATPSTVRASAAMDLRTAAGQHITAELTNDDLLIASGARGSRCFIDAKARPCYIAVHDSRFVRRLSELSDAERDDIWSTLFGVLRANHGGAFDRIEVNAGSYQNVPHLHLKAFVPLRAFDAALRGNDAFARLCHTLRIEEEVGGDVGRLFWGLLHGPRSLRERIARIAPRVRRELVGGGETCALVVNRVPLSVRIAPNVVESVLLPLAFWIARMARIEVGGDNDGGGSRSRRVIVGIAGAAASGKSTTSHLLARVLTASLGVPAAVLSMDAYHLCNAELDRLGLRSEKGRPATIDSAALLRDVARLRNASSSATGAPCIYVPDYDRAETHDPIAGALRIDASVRVVLVEGLYISRGEREGEDTSVWAALRACCDATVYLEVGEELARERIVARRSADPGSGSGDAAAAAARAHYDERDLPTAREMASAGDADSATIVFRLDDAEPFGLASFRIARAAVDRCAQ